MSRSLDMIAAVARQLGALREEVVFLGGATLDFQVTDAVVKAMGLRATIDIDIVVEVSSRADYYRLRDRLIAARFSEDTLDGVMCRWIGDGGFKVDVMPSEPTVLGFANRWYRPAIERAVRHEIEGLGIRVISAPYFLATKIEAFRSRGRSDYVASVDLEDFVTVVDGRSTIAEEVAAAAGDLRDYLVGEISNLVLHDAGLFLDALPGHLRGDIGREQLLLDRLERIRTGLP